MSSVHEAAVQITTAPAASRGHRLHPSRFSRLYWHLTQLRRTLEGMIAEFDPAQLKTLVDIGCGNMPYRPLFASLVDRYIGCDFPGNEMAAVVLQADGRVPIDSHSADIVLSSQVLEHVADPAMYLAEARRILKPQGVLLLSTHGAWRFHPDPFDFWRWTCQGLRREIEGAGFEIVRFKGVMGPASTALQLWQDAALDRVPRLFRNAFTLVMQQLIAIADRRCTDENRDKDACVYVVLARKLAEFE